MSNSAYGHGLPGVPMTMLGSGNQAVFRPDRDLLARRAQIEKLAQRHPESDPDPYKSLMSGHYRTPTEVTSGLGMNAVQQYNIEQRLYQIAMSGGGTVQMRQDLAALAREADLADDARRWLQTRGIAYCIDQTATKSLFLRKASGEGSRGGKIIGHYASGRPKYASNRERLPAASELASKPHTLTGDQHAALREYVGNHFAEIQAHLRGKTIDGFEPEHSPQVSRLLATHASHLQSAIDKSPLLADTTVYRGIIAPEGHNIGRFKVGDTFKDDGFCSASDSEKTAKRFALQEDADGDHPIRVLFSISLSKGQKALRVADHESKEKTLANNDEGEYILPHGSRFQVDHVSEVSGVKHIEISVVRP